jgi:hypothetical protein
MKYVTPTIEVFQLRSEDIMTISVGKTALYGESVAFWDGTEIEI